MWNLLGQGSTFTTYRPTTVAGTITNPTLSYDVDDPPWATAAVGPTKVGSTTVNVTDDVYVTWSGFPSLAKANFSTCNLSFVVSASQTVACAGTNSIAAPPHGVFAEYQNDGSTWLPVVPYSFGIKAGFPGSLPGLWEDFTTITNGSSRSATKLPVSVSIPASTFSSNLNNLKFRIHTVNTTFVGGADWQNTTNYSVWDIRADVS